MTYNFASTARDRDDVLEDHFDRFFETQQETFRSVNDANDISSLTKTMVFSKKKD